MSRHSLLLALGGALVATPATAQADLLAGHVQDPDGKPLEHVFVRQAAATAVAFSDAHGNFKLKIDPAAPAEILASAPGRVPARVSLAIARSPLVLAAAPVAALPGPPEPLASLPAPASLLGTRFGLRTDWRRLAVGGAGGNAVTGAIDGEVGLQAALKTGDWLWRASAERSRASVRLPSLTPREGDATFAPETVEGLLGVGYLVGTPAWSVSPYLTALYRSVQAGTNRSAYSGTVLDWDQTRTGLGAGVEAAALLPWNLETAMDLCALPVVPVRLAGAPVQPSGVYGARLGASVGYSIGYGVRLDLVYRHDLWRGSHYAEDADVLAAGCTYVVDRSR